MNRPLLGCLIGLLAAGCAQPQPKMVWMRMDGTPLRASANLIQQFELARLQCQGDAATAAANSPQPALPSVYLMVMATEQRNSTMDAVMRACMSRVGFVLVQAPA